MGLASAIRIWRSRRPCLAAWPPPPRGYRAGSPELFPLLEPFFPPPEGRLKSRGRPQACPARCLTSARCDSDAPPACCDPNPTGVACWHRAEPRATTVESFAADVGHSGSSPFSAAFFTLYVPHRWCQPPDRPAPLRNRINRSTCRSKSNPVYMFTCLHANPRVTCLHGHQSCHSNPLPALQLRSVQSLEGVSEFDGSFAPMWGTRVVAIFCSGAQLACFHAITDRGRDHLPTVVQSPQPH